MNTTSASLKKARTSTEGENGCMVPDQDTWIALAAIRSLLGRVSTTARSPNFEALVDIVNLALWEPDRRQAGARMRSLQDSIDGRYANLRQRDCYWFN